ncbi:MAG: DNA translocase FtsK [Oscillospiraceae bacterium]
MASTQKKTKKGKKAPPKPELPAYNGMARLIGGIVCLLLALCVLVSYFNVDALLLTFIAKALKGTLGCGYYLAAPALLGVAVIQLRHQGRPVILRTTCTLLVPLLAGVLWHLIFCRAAYELGGGLLSLLWKDGQALDCGGVVAGGLALGSEALVSKVVSIIIFVVLLLAALLGALHMTPQQAVDKMREYRDSRWDDEDGEDDLPDDFEPLPRRRTSSAPEKPVKEKPARKRAGIDIPLDGEPSAMESGAKKEFFTRKSDTVRTPDQVLEQKAAPEPAPAAQEAAPVKEPVSAKTKKAQLQQEVESAAQEVSQAIEQELAQGEEAYRYPPITLLEENHADNCTEVGAELRNNSRRLAEALRSFGVDAAAGDVVHGPSVTRYEFTLEQGVKLSKITNLSDDIALALGASGVRVAPVPNKISVVGIEVPNRTVTAVRIRDVIESREFTRHPSSVAFAVGKDIGGNNIVGNIAKLPHVLIAGTTGSGKSVCTNSLIVSILYKSTPDEVRFIMVDPKMVELAPYNGIPHLLIPVVTDPKKAAGALQWAVFEMMKRYKMFSEKGVKDLAGYNALAEVDEDVKKLPTVVVVIDELADLMLVAAKEVEESICRVAQMGRAAGMHLVVATQRPSADVITGLMKANIPSRIAFAVASSMESRIILDTPGAEKLVGKGDMLYAPLGDSKPTRVQGCFITPEEIERVVAFVKDAAGEAHYDQDVIEKIQQAVDAKSDKGKASPTDGAADGDDGDELLPAAVEVVLETGQASVSMLQRRLKLGYSRAARLVDQMEERGYVGPFEGSKPRQLLITREKWQELQMAKGAAPAETPPAADRYGSIHDVFESHDALD